MPPKYLFPQISCVNNLRSSEHLIQNIARTPPELHGILLLFCSSMPPKVTKALRPVSVPRPGPTAPFLGLQQQSSFFDIARSSEFTLSVSKEFRNSSSVSLINPRHHRIATDQVSLRLPTISFSGLSDEAVLALFTKGFFGGWVFSIERWIMKMGGWRILPVGYTGTTDKGIAFKSS